MEIEEITKNKLKMGTIAQLADKIWRECYADILSCEQIEYMLNNFQSLNAMLNQINKDGYRYFAIKENSAITGYFAIKEEPEKIFLSKLYLSSDARGKGYSRAVLTYIRLNLLSPRQKAIYLTVNKRNPSAKIYDKLGFKITDSVITDIGNGFVMDDYIMELAFP